MSFKNGKSVLRAAAVTAAGATILTGVPAAAADGLTAQGWINYRVAMPGASSAGRVRVIQGKITVVGRTVDQTCRDGSAYTKITVRPTPRPPLKLGYACGSSRGFQVAIAARSIAIQVCSARRNKCSKAFTFKPHVA